MIEILERRWKVNKQEIHCNCIQESENYVLEKVKEKLIDDDSVSDISVSMKQIVLTQKGDLLKFITCNEIGVSFLKAGKWKKRRVMMKHVFCPFCGIRIEKEVQGATS